MVVQVSKKRAITSKRNTLVRNWSSNLMPLHWGNCDLLHIDSNQLSMKQKVTFPKMTDQE